MADWIKCQLNSNPPMTAYINLDQVVAITERENGCMVWYSGSEEPFEVKNPVPAILGSRVKNA